MAYWYISNQIRAFLRSLSSTSTRRGTAYNTIMLKWFKKKLKPEIIIIIRYYNNGTVAKQPLDGAVRS